MPGVAGSEGHDNTFLIALFHSGIDRKLIASRFFNKNLRTLSCHTE